MPKSPATPQTIHPFKGWLVCLTASLFIFYEFIQMNALNVVSSDLLGTLSLNASELSDLSSVYFYANLLLLLPAGLLLDRFSIRILMVIAMVISTLGVFCFAWQAPGWVLLVGRLLTGAGSAFSFIGCVKLASRWFLPTRMGLMVGIIATFAMLGGIVAQTPLALLIEHVGWHAAMRFNGLIGIVITLLIAGLVVDTPASSKAISENQSEAPSLSAWKSLRLVLIRPQNWLCGLYASAIIQPVYLLGGLWGILFLKQAAHLSMLQASVATSMLFVGGIIGTPSIGWLSDRLGLRRLPMTCSALLSVFALLGVITLPHLSHPFAWSMGLLLLLGITTSSQALSYPLSAESNPKALTAMTASIISLCAIGGGALFEPLFGWLMDADWTGTLVHRVPFYSIANYQLAFMLFIVGAVLSFVVSLFLKETHCRRQSV